MAAVSVRSSPDIPETKPPVPIEQGYMPSQGPAASVNGNGVGSAGSLASGSGTGMVNGIANAESSTRRSVSPVKVDQEKQAKESAPAPAPAPQPVSAIPKHDRPIDMRAEEDAARRLNVGKVVGNSKYAGNEARGRKTDLFGPELKIRLERRAKNHQTAFDEDALAYLSKAAESRLRQVLSSSVSAQQHRTTTSYFHPPPMTSSSGASGSKPPRAMWDVSVSSDPSAVMDVLNRQSKEAEREFRTSRMNRLAKEHELERLRERQAALSGGDHNNTGPSAIPSGSGSGSGSSAQAPSPGGMNGDSGDSPGAHPPSSPDRSAPPPTVRQDSTPTFGGPKKLSKGLKKNAKDVSADVQIKMSNATAMRSAGMGKKYSWMSSAPNISSPLSGNKKKGKKGKAVEADAEGEDEEGTGMDAGQGGDNGGVGGSRQGSGLKKRKQDGGDGTTRSKRRRLPKAPTRRMVSVASGLDADTKQEGEAAGKMVSDDKCLTITDVVFALDRDKQRGQGMGTSDEIVRRVMARPGGPWGDLQYRPNEVKRS